MEGPGGKESTRPSLFSGHDFRFLRLGKGSSIGVGGCAVIVVLGRAKGAPTFEPKAALRSNATRDSPPSHPQLVWQNSFDNACWRGTADAAAIAVCDGDFPARLKGRAGARALQSGSVTWACTIT